MTATELLRFLGVPLLNSDSNALTRECGGMLRDYVGETKRINGRDRWRVPLNKVAAWRNGSRSSPGRRKISSTEPGLPVGGGVGKSGVTKWGGGQGCRARRAPEPPLPLPPPPTSDSAPGPSGPAYRDEAQRLRPTG